VIGGLLITASTMVLAPATALACDEITNPCTFGRCWVNEDFVGFDGEYIFVGPGRPVECAW
jgi:hypothetical protein